MGADVSTLGKEKIMKQYELSATLNVAKGIVISYRVSVGNHTQDLESLEKALKQRAVVNFNDATEKLVNFNQIEIKEIK